MVELEICNYALSYQPISARTPDGLNISVQDHDRNGGRDVLFIHGFSQSSIAWLKQTSSLLKSNARLVTYDLRGHGASDKPTDAGFYRDPRSWAGEVAAVIEAAEMSDPVIVCWSYAGRVALDFLMHEGDERISGLVMVAATSTTRDGVLGPATHCLRDMASASDLAENLSATAALLGKCTASPLPADERELMFGYNLLTPPAVRQAMTGREASYDEVLEDLSAPLLAVHGVQDPINLVAMSEHTCSKAPNAELKLYQESGHMPFWEQSERFNADLAGFLTSLS